jgi:hypothetical protein
MISASAWLFMQSAWHFARIPVRRSLAQLFVLFVLGGKDPIDYVQHLELRAGGRATPLLKRIMRIHVTGEARHHLSFARH